MGILISPNGTRCALSARTLLGRSPACAVTVSDGRVSGEHLLLEWADGGWFVRDLGSSNGTWLDGVRVPPGKRLRLEPGARIGVGAADSTWEMADCDAPGVVARAADGRIVRAEGGVLLLPDTDAPEAVLIEDADGWLLEGEGRRVGTGDVVQAGDAWTVDIPTVFARTVDGGGELSLRFEVSPDEEFCRVTVVRGSERLPHPPRSFDYLLLTLARARLSDSDHGDDVQGWVDVEDLAHMLRLEPTTVNVQIHRARQSYGKLVPGLGKTLVERRPGTRQLRLGVRGLSVERMG